MDWSAVGGLEMFKAHQVPSAYDEFADDEARKVPGLGENGRMPEKYENEKMASRKWLTLQRG